MSRLASRLLAMGAGAYALAASLVYTLVVTRRLPLQDLATLTVFNAGFAVALSILGYATTWYPRILAKEPHRFPELAAAGLITAFIAWAALAAYMALYGRLDPAVLALGLGLLALNAWPAGAYLSVHAQRTSALLSYVVQTVKLAGALAVRASPSVHAALAVNLLMALPTAAAKAAWPRFKEAWRALADFLRGAPYQTLTILTTTAGAAATYAVYAAGGDAMLAYSYVLFQLGKSVYPALAIVPLMYGSLLVERDKLRRALLDGAVLLYLYLVVAAVMAKSPDWYIALLRPAELDNWELVEAVRLNAYALLASGILLHLNTTLLGAEEKAVVTLRDPPAKALVWDLAAAPFAVAVTYLLTKHYGAPGMVAATAISTAVGAAYRLRLLGRRYAPLVTQLYAPALLTLTAVFLLPLPVLPYARNNIVALILTYLPNAVIIGAVVLAIQYAASKPTKLAVSTLLRRIGLAKARDGVLRRA
ncbi:MAG: hypothetical protein QW247_09465 [Pyrobaculum sp.]